MILRYVRQGVHPNLPLWRRQGTSGIPDKQSGSLIIFRAAPALVSSGTDKKKPGDNEI